MFTCPFAGVTDRRTARPLVAAATAALVLSLAACGRSDSDHDEAGAKPRTSKVSASESSASRQGTSPSSRPPSAAPTTPADDRIPVTDLPSDASDQAKEGLVGLKALELQVALREIHPSLGTSGDVKKAGEQCEELSRGVDDPQAAARRFSPAVHKLTEADGKRINALLRKDFCP